jgi:hypothetical protein
MNNQSVHMFAVTFNTTRHRDTETGLTPSLVLGKQTSGHGAALGG